ncbi:MAG: murein hydrolase activator EnvC [Sphingomonadaceae bacterium]
MRAVAAGLSLLLALTASVPAASAAPKPTERSKQKAAAEAERVGLQQKLDALKRDISKTESAKDDAADTLAESEQAISNANRALRDLQREQEDTNLKLQQLSAEHQRLAATVEQQKKQLAKLLREQYVAGNEDRIKLLLSGDNPNRINRDLQMMAYVSQAQARLLAALRANLTAVEVNQAEAQNAKDELEEIAQEQIQQKALLEQEKGRRAALLASLSKRLVAQRKEAGNVERDEQRMAGLVDKLNKLIAEQALAAAAEKKRQEQLAIARAEAKAKAEAEARAQARAKAAAEAERQRLAKANAAKPGAKPAAPPKADAIDADEPKLAARPEPKPEARKPEPDPAAARPADIALAPAAPAGAFASLKGELRSPVAGKLAAKFGAKRGDGPSWKGVFIRAGEGADVHSVAAGRVVFAEWLRGFGNLIIVDHGGQYMSIYGNNQALLKRAGDIVKAGDPIASAGNSGGNEESGLYFELRHQGRAFDPATWVKF